MHSKITSPIVPCIVPCTCCCRPLEQLQQASKHLNWHPQIIHITCIHTHTYPYSLHVTSVTQDSTQTHKQTHTLTHSIRHRRTQDAQSLDGDFLIFSIPCMVSTSCPGGRKKWVAAGIPRIPVALAGICTPAL